MSQWILETPLFAGAQGVTSGARKNMQLHTNNQSTGGAAADNAQPETAYNPQYQPQFNNYIPREILDFERHSLINSTSAGPGENGPKITSAGGFLPKSYHGVFAKARYSAARDYAESVQGSHMDSVEPLSGRGKDGAEKRKLERRKSCQSTIGGQSRFTRFKSRAQATNPGRSGNKTEMK